MRNNRNILLLIFLNIYLSTSYTDLPGRCKNDTDCDSNMKCVGVELGVNDVVYKCTPYTDDIPICNGTDHGMCPYPDDGIPSLMCLFVKTTLLRGYKCCSSGRRLTNSSSSSSSNTTDTSTTTTTTSSGCLECFPDPSTSKTIAGSYQCIPYTECKSKAAFTSACDLSNLCLSGDNELCNNNGICYTTNSNDPITSYACQCKPGYGSTMCGTVTSNKCIFNCKVGGNCTDGECVCNSGYTGNQCLGCTKNSTCHYSQDNGYCYVTNNTCICNEGTVGTFCSSSGSSSGSVDLCNGVTCGSKGQCISGVCYCRQGCTDATCPKCSTNACTACSLSSQIVINIKVLLVLTFGMLMINA